MISFAISALSPVISLMIFVISEPISVISVALLGDEAQRDRLVEDVRSGPREHGHLEEWGW